MAAEDSFLVVVCPRIITYNTLPCEPWPSSLSFCVANIPVSFVVFEVLLLLRKFAKADKLLLN